MARLGGRIARRVRRAATEGGPTEVHVVTFPSKEAFEAYRVDAAAWATERQEVIAQTVVWVGEDADPFTTGAQ